MIGRKSSSGEEETSKIKRKLDNTHMEKKIQNSENPPKTLKVSHLLFKTIKNTSSVFLLSSTTTIINFLCNIPLLRAVSKESFGTVKVYFELAFSLINYIPRETIRRTSQKFCPDKDPIKEKQKYILTSQLNMIIMAIFAFIGIFIFFSFLLFTHSEQLHHNLIQLVIYMLCALIELLCEPIILYMNLKVENKFIPITVSSLSRIVTNTVLAVFFKLDLWSFTLSRVTGSLVYLSYITYLGYYKYKINFRDFIPKDIGLLIRGKIKDEINLQYLRVVLFQFVRLNLLNLIIQNCEGLILSFVIKNSEEEKSDYSFVAQNFSLLLRFFIEPVTDAFYILVNKLKYMEKKEENKIINNDVNKDNDKDINSDVNESVIKIEEEKNDKNNTNLYEKQDSPDSPDTIIEKENTESNTSDNNDENKNIIIKEPNIILSLNVLKLFMKIFLSCGIILIAYYILFGIHIMELIYGHKWANYNIDKIGDSYTYYVVISSIVSIVESFANATNNSRQMDFSYISLIVNSLLLIIFMNIFSRWDICGIIMANVLSSLFIINCHLYIVFCGKKEKIENTNEKYSLIGEILSFQKNCFISFKSIIITSILIGVGYFLKKLVLVNSGLVMICGFCGFIILLNSCFICFFEYKKFKENLDDIKSYN